MKSCLRIRPIALAAMALLAPVMSSAADYTTEWRVMGPAFSFHSNTNGAQLRQVVSFFECSATTDTHGYVYETPATATVSKMQTLGIPARECPRSRDMTSPGGQYLRSIPWEGITYYEAQSNIVAITAPDGHIYTRDIPKSVSYTPIAKIYQFQESENVKNWQSNNPAIGLQYTRRYDDHSEKAYVSYVRDSYGSPSLMLGGAYMFPLLTRDNWNIDGGVVGGVWFRSTLNEKTNEIVRSTVPFVFPGISITEKRSGLGVDIGLAPELSFEIAGTKYSMPTTLMVQATYLISRTEKSSKKLAVEPTPGGLHAVATITF